MVVLEEEIEVVEEVDFLLVVVEAVSHPEEEGEEDLVVVVVDTLMSLLVRCLVRLISPLLGILVDCWSLTFFRRHQLFSSTFRAILLGQSWVLGNATEMGSFVHACEGEMVCESTNPSKVQSLNSKPISAICTDLEIPNHSLLYWHLYLSVSLVHILLRLQVPYFNAPIYLQNKSSIGKIDEILGPINQVYFTIKPSEGIQATSFQAMKSQNNLLAVNLRIEHS